MEKKAQDLKRADDMTNEIRLDVKTPEPQSVVVVFDVWGQRSETVFDKDSELAPLEWCKRIVEKNLARPIEIYLLSTRAKLIDAGLMERMISQWDQ